MDPLVVQGVRLAWRRVDAGASRREVAYALLRELAGDPDLALTQTCARCGGNHGPVEAGSLRVSVAYARARGSGDEVAVVAVSEAVSALGIDAEFEVDAVREAAGFAGTLRRDDADVRDWARVEAALKASGAGVRINPAHVQVEVEGDTWRAAAPGAGSFTGVDVTHIPHLVVAVAYA